METEYQEPKEVKYFLAYTQGSSPEIVTEQQVRDRKMWIIEDIDEEDIDDIKSELGEDV